MPYCAAMAMTTGRVRMDAFSEDLLKDQSLRTLMDKVDFTVDEQLTSEFPKRRAAHVAIETTGGDTFEHYSPTRKGDPDNPLTDTELAGKFLELTEPALGDGAALLLDALWRLDEARDLVSLPIHSTGAAAQ